jgi:hypothetical protein
MGIASRLFAKFLAWKWERDYRSAVSRMRGCEHVNTVEVDVGVVAEKCRDCWALRMPALDGSDRMAWFANCAPPPRKSW